MTVGPPPAMLERLRAAVAAAPLHPGHHYNLGVLLDELGDAAGAAACFTQAARLKPDFHQAWNNLGLALERLQRFDEARAALSEALALQPQYPAALKNLGRLASDAGEVDLARACYRRLLEAEPGNWSARLAAGLLLPPVPVSEIALRAAREGYADALAELEQLAAQPIGTVAQRQGAAERHNNFFLAYQGEDDRPLQEHYAGLVRRLVGDGPPELGEPPERAPDGRLRVGFAGCFFRDCTVGHYFRSWIGDLDPRQFEVWLFLLGGPEDSLTEALRARAHRTLRLDGPLAQVAQAVLEAAPEVLVYPELGMNGRSYALASLRLAPVQCAGWGHPVTSGHASIDHFLSCAEMEPSEADSHYSEHLVRLPGLGTRYTPPAVGTARRRGDFGLPEGRPLFFFPHAPYKVHPENDSLLARLLAQIPDAWLVLCQGFVAAQTAALRARFAAAGIADDRIVTLPHLPRAEFLEAARLCDAMLDTTRWSGGNTSLDALAAGLPIVTRRGRFMRGRQSAAMLERIGVPELIAADDDAYLSLTRRLVVDPPWRHSLCQRIAEGRSRLFDDPAPIAALSAFLLAQRRA